MSYPIVLDVETQHAFQEVGYEMKKLKVSIACIYDYANDTYDSYFEKDLDNLFRKLEHASFVIGFNLKKFDLPVLSPYYLGSVGQFTILDLLEEAEKNLGDRLALDDLARATLKSGKNGHGFMAIEYFRKGNFASLKKYCLEDVRITKELYEYGLKNKKLLFQNSRGLREIPVNFEIREKNSTSVSLSLPF